jgi:hypothetical protein
MPERFISEQRLLHSQYEPKGPLVETLTLNDRADGVAKLLFEALSENRDEANKARQELRKGFFIEMNNLNLSGKVKTFDQWRQYVKSLPKGHRARETYYDWFDGAAMATLWGIDCDNDLKVKISTKDYDGIDARFGVSELKGIGRVVAETAITDERLLRRLNLIDAQVSSGVTPPEVFKGALGDITTWYNDLNSGVDARQAEMVIAYLSAVVAGGKAEEAVGASQQSSPYREAEDPRLMKEKGIVVLTDPDSWRVDKWKSGDREIISFW